MPSSLPLIFLLQILCLLIEVTTTVGCKTAAMNGHNYHRQQELELKNKNNFEKPASRQFFHQQRKPTNELKGSPALLKYKDERTFDLNKPCGEEMKTANIFLADVRAAGPDGAPR